MCSTVLFGRSQSQFLLHKAIFSLEQCCGEKTSLVLPWLKLVLIEGVNGRMRIFVWLMKLWESLRCAKFLPQKGFLRTDPVLFRTWLVTWGRPIIICYAVVDEWKMLHHWVTNRHDEWQTWLNEWCKQEWTYLLLVRMFVPLGWSSNLECLRFVK